MTTLVTSAETVTAGQRLDQAQVDLENHVAKTHGQTHLGHLVTNPGTPYSDSSGQSWPSTSGRVSVIVINGTPYYFPSQAI